MAKIKEEKDIITKDLEKEVRDVAALVVEAPAEGGSASGGEPTFTSAEEPRANLEERVISIDRVSRTQKGGRRMRFRALVVVGDRHGNVGMGLGKSNEITGAVAKATSSAKKNMFTVPIVRKTIPHEIVSKFGTARVMLKPASIGVSIIAGSSVRPILELAGIENVVGKCLTRTTNKLNNAYATMEALKGLKDIKEIAPRPYKKPSKKSAAKTPTNVGEAK